MDALFVCIHPYCDQKNRLIDDVQDIQTKHIGKSHQIWSISDLQQEIQLRQKDFNLLQQFPTLDEIQQEIDSFFIKIEDTYNHWMEVLKNEISNQLKKSSKIIQFKNIHQAILHADVVRLQEFQNLLPQYSLYYEGEKTKIQEEINQYNILKLQIQSHMIMTQDKLEEFITNHSNTCSLVHVIYQPLNDSKKWKWSQQKKSLNCQLKINNDQISPQNSTENHRILLEPCLSMQDPQSVSIMFKGLQEDWGASVFICDWNTRQQLDPYFNKSVEMNFGTYQLHSSGTLMSHHDKTIHNEQKGFKINSLDTIKVLWTNPRLILINMTSQETYVFETKFKKQAQVYIGIGLGCSEASIVQK